jgi:signal transduction histidine kinase
MAGNTSLIQEMKLNRITLSFPEKNERLFLRKYFTNSLLQFRISFVLVTFLYAIFSLLDQVIIPNFAIIFYAIRFYIVVPFLVLVFILSFFPFFKLIWQYLLFISFLVAGGGICVMTSLVPENFTYYLGLMLIFSAGYFFIKLRFFAAALAGLITLVFYNVGAIFYSSVNSNIILSNDFFYASINLIGMAAAYHIEYYARRDFYLNQQLDEQNEEVEYLNLNLEKAVEKRTIELVEAKNKAEQSDKLKSAFLASMSHEIRTPMNAIIGFAQVLEQSDDDEERTECVEVIKSNGSHLLALLDDIMDISKIEAGVLELHETEFSLNELMNEIYKVMEVDENVKSKELKIIIKNTLGDGDSIIVADQKRLKQILINLAFNAGKFTDTGFIEIGYQLIQDDLYFYVKDTGRGIELEKQAYIFERFMQGNLDHQPEKEGSGLGLAISKSLTKLFKGDIWVESEIGKGSIFYFNLPFIKGSKSTLKIEKINSEIMEYNWKNKVILIAEDVATNYLLVKKSLRKTEVELIWAKNGQEAVDEIKNNQSIDLVLMDIRMPIMNGLEATRQIKEIYPEMPIIAQTAYAMDGDRERSLQAGCDEYIAKPINLKEFIELIAKFIDK